MVASLHIGSEISARIFKIPFCNNPRVFTFSLEYATLDKIQENWRM